ncbi:MAG TPA: PhzF family phenazine biosynthesis protein [Fimbriimonadaceae bacterium]|nr:PhzF family phenazine biosynthesis protein [Fimbriimonadaceae bacterium]
MSLPIFVVDAFSDTPFRGNPAGVCVTDNPIDEALMQSFAMEMNHAETAFLHPVGPQTYGLRWFTPAQEVPLCGHATLASAHILFTEMGLSDKVTFNTASGPLTAIQRGEKIELDFPTEFVTQAQSTLQCSEALGEPVQYLGDNRMFWLAELASEQAVRNCSPNLDLVKQLGKEGVIVTAKSDSEADDFVSRLFAPNVGIDEDPVTGSAHCLLAPYWATKLGKEQMIGYQASKRGGYVEIEYLGARVLLRGNAVTVLRGTLNLNGSVK